MEYQYEYIGLIPAGGKGTRMAPYRGIKELINIGYYNDLTPKVLSEYSLDQLIHANIDKVYMIINSQKFELLKYYESGAYHNINIAYLCQDISGAYGLPNAIDAAYEWTKDKNVCMVLPDTICQPKDSVKELIRLHATICADVTLGVYPTDNPCALAPVIMEKDGCVKSIIDKPKTTNIYNTWNSAVWGPSFSELLHRYVQKESGKSSMKAEITLSEIFNAAIKQGLRVYGKLFENGVCHDLGNINKLNDYLEKSRDENRILNNLN